MKKALKKFKKLFCRHIYKEYKKVELGRVREVFDYGRGIDISYFDRHAHYLRCIKCGKEKITTSSKLV